uniref:Protein MMS22-like n=1 Tax=Anopheles epiroticus TaxID=199890 RepID=A0A182PNV2_9DIPT
MISIFGVEVNQLYDLLVYDLSKKARERIQKLKLLQTTATNRISIQRYEVTRFLRLVLGNAMSATGTTLRESITMIFNCLPRLIDPLQMYGWNSLFDREYCGYEMYHGVLEWRWLTLLLATEIKECSEPTDEEYEYCFRKKKTYQSFGKLYRALMIDLLELAFCLFHINAIEDIVAEPPYHCNCVRLMWLGMMVLAHKNPEHVDFWTCLTESIPSILETKDKKRKDGYLFKIWLINALAHFHEQHVPLEGTEKPAVKLSYNYSTIDMIVKEFLNAVIEEKQVRVFLILLKPIITRLWPERFEIVIAIWDYFSIRLNSSFLMSNSSLEVLACVSRSIDGFIQQAISLASPDSTVCKLDPKMNSFNIFLMMLSSTIRHFTAKELKTKVQIIFNRIFLKLGPKKYENMTEQAIYNLALMMLTMISATSFTEDYSRVSKQMLLVPLLGGPANLPIDAIVKRIVIATQAHMALLVLFSDSSFDKTPHIVCFLRDFEIAYQKYGNRLLPAMEVIAEGTSSIYCKAVSKSLLTRGEISLIAPWMLKYLRQSTSDGKHKVLKALSACLECSFSSTDDTFLTAINQHVMPFVKDQFCKKTVAPSCIAEIAARMTANACESINNQNEQINSNFNTFANCTTAHSDQVVAYLNVIAESRKVVTVVGERVIIRLWLKMCFYHDREKLLQLTRVVHSLDEFRMLCEIPEYEMFESKAIPIELFFRFIGKRFREVSSEKQMEMKMKLHLLFQHFDKWIPNPNGIIRQRILAVLVLALKECAAAFYIKSNTTCLYYVAFQHFFLPFSILTGRNVQIDLVEDVARVWHKVMEVLGKMDYSSDPMIGDHVCNMLTKWVPQFAKLPNPENALRPLMLFFCSRNEELVLYAMPRFVVAYVDLQRCLPKPNALEAMQILQRLLQSLLQRNDYGKIILLIRTTGLSLMQHAFMCNETYPTRALAMEMLSDLLISTEGPSNIVKQEMRNIFASFTQKYMSLTAESYFTFIGRLADRHNQFIGSILDLIRSEVSQAEIKRGNGRDMFLRRALQRLESVTEKK